MEITEIKIIPVKEGQLRAVVSITFDNCFVISGPMLVHGKKGYSPLDAEFVDDGNSAGGASCISGKPQFAHRTWNTLTIGKSEHRS